MADSFEHFDAGEVRARFFKCLVVLQHVVASDQPIVHRDEVGDRDRDFIEVVLVSERFFCSVDFEVQVLSVVVSLKFLTLIKLENVPRDPH